MFDEKSLRRKLWFSISEEEDSTWTIVKPSTSVKNHSFWDFSIIFRSFNFNFCLELEFMLQDNHISLMRLFSICFAGELYFLVVLI